MTPKRMRIILALATVLALACVAFGATYALFGAQVPIADGTFASGTLVITSVTPHGQVFTTDLRVGNLTPGDEGWGKVRIQNVGSLDAWVWFTDYTIGYREDSVFRDVSGGTAGPRLTLAHTPGVKLIPAGQTREFSLEYRYPLEVPNQHQGRTGAATLEFVGVQVDENAGQGWDRTVTGEASVAFATGQVKFTMPAGAATATISQSGYTDTPLSALAGLSYQTYVRSGYTVAPGAVLSVDTTGDRHPDAVLTFVPSDNGAVETETWQTWNAITPSTQWRVSGAPGTTTLSDFTAAHPTARIVPDGTTGGLRFVAGTDGGDWANFQGYLDSVTVTTAEGVDLYDFD